MCPNGIHGRVLIDNLDQQPIGTPLTPWLTLNQHLGQQSTNFRSID